MQNIFLFFCFLLLLFCFFVSRNLIISFHNSFTFPISCFFWKTQLLQGVAAYQDWIILSECDCLCEPKQVFFFWFAHHSLTKYIFFIIFRINIKIMYISLNMNHPNFERNNWGSFLSNLLTNRYKGPK